MKFLNEDELVDWYTCLILESLQINACTPSSRPDEYDRVYYKLIDMAREIRTEAEKEK
jgi:hypothetical protein